MDVFCVFRFGYRSPIHVQLYFHVLSFEGVINISNILQPTQILKIVFLCLSHIIQRTEYFCEISED